MMTEKRCKDCIYFDKKTLFCHYHSKYYDGGTHLDTFKYSDFCSYGERKTDNGKKVD